MLGIIVKYLKLGLALLPMSALAIDASRQNIDGWDFSGEYNNNIDYTYSDFSYAVGAATFASDGYDRNFSNSDFSNSNISKSNFTAVIIYNCDFSYATLHNVNFSSVELDGSSFLNADIMNANFSNITGFTGKIFESTANFSTKNIGAVVFDNNDFSKYTNGWVLNMSGMNMVGASICESIMTGNNFSGANMSASLLNSTNFDEANFKNAVVQNAEIVSADFINANLEYADFRGTSMDSAYNMVLKNTICQNGVVEGGLNMSKGDIFRVGRHLLTDSTAGYGVTLDKNSSLGGATLIFDNAGGTQVGSQTTVISIDGATFRLDDSIIEINLASDADDVKEILLFKLINGGSIDYSSLKNSNILVRRSDSSSYDGFWFFNRDGDNVYLQIPEAGNSAALAGLMSLAFVLCAMKRRCR